MSASEIWWTVRWHLARVTIGTPTHAVAATRDGLRAFRREFGRTFDNRWKANERAEFRRRWEASR